MIRESLLPEAAGMADIYSKIQIKDVTFPNRIVMAPMVRFGYTNVGGVMYERLINDHLSRSGCGAGLVITEALYVTTNTMITPEYIWRAGAYSDEHIPYLRRLADSYHAGSSVLFAQLAHPGFSYGDPVARDINCISVQEIETIRDGFISAAVRCKLAGFDGVELHGAHTFFLNCFASATANLREDRYGGELSGRLTLIREIIQGIREQAGEDFLISYRMGWTENRPCDIETAKALEQLGLDLIHISTGIPEQREIHIPEDFDYNEVVYTASYIKDKLTIPVTAVNQIRTIRRGSILIEHGYADFAAFGKPFLADTGFAVRAINDPEYMPCLECPGCRWFTDGSSCPVQIKLGQAH